MPTYSESVMFSALGVDKTERDVKRLDKALQALAATSKAMRSGTDPFAAMTRGMQLARSGIESLNRDLRVGVSGARRMADQLARVNAEMGRMGRLSSAAARLTGPNSTGRSGTAASAARGATAARDMSTAEILRAQRGLMAGIAAEETARLSMIERTARGLVAAENQGKAAALAAIAAEDAARQRMLMNASRGIKKLAQDETTALGKREAARERMLANASRGVARLNEREAARLSAPGRQAATNPQQPKAFSITGKPIYENGLENEGIAARTRALRGLAAMEREAASAADTRRKSDERASRSDAASAARMQARAESERRRNAEHAARNAPHLFGSHGGRGEHGYGAWFGMGHHTGVGVSGLSLPGAMALQVAGNVVIHATHVALEGATEGSTARSRLWQMGATSKETKMAEGIAQKIHKAFPTTSTSEALTNAAEALQFTKDPKAIDTVVRGIAKQRSFAIERGEGSKTVEGGTIKLLAALDFMGAFRPDPNNHDKLSDLGKLQEISQAFVDVQARLGRTINPSVMKQSVIQAGPLAMTISPEGWQKLFIYAADVGSRAGTQPKMMDRLLSGLTGGPIGKHVTEAMMRLGFMKQESVANGRIHAVDEAYWNRDPLGFVGEYGAKFMREYRDDSHPKGLDPNHPEDVKKFIGTIRYSGTGLNSTLSTFMEETISKAIEYNRSLHAMKDSRTNYIDAATTHLRDFKSSDAALNASLKDLGNKIGEGTLGKTYLQASNMLREEIERVNRLISGEAKTGDAIRVGGEVLGVGAATAIGGLITKGVMNFLLVPLSTNTTATSANTIALNTNTAALTKGGVADAIKTGASTTAGASAVAGSSTVAAVTAAATPAAIALGTAYIAAGRDRPEEIVNANARMADITKQLTVLEGNLASGHSADPEKTQEKIDALRGESGRLSTMLGTLSNSTEYTRARDQIGPEDPRHGPEYNAAIEAQLQTARDAARTATSTENALPKFDAVGLAITESGARTVVPLEGALPKLDTVNTTLTEGRSVATAIQQETNRVATGVESTIPKFEAIQVGVAEVKSVSSDVLTQATQTNNWLSKVVDMLAKIGSASAGSESGGGGFGGGGRFGHGASLGDMSRRGGAPAGARGIAMKAAMQQYIAEGGSPSNARAAAAMMVGQADMESKLNPNQIHDHGTGFGIYGARLDRRARMFTWLQNQGYERNSLIGQQKYMVHEAMTDSRFSPTRHALLNANAGNIAANTRAVTENFEAPKITNNRSGAVLQAFRSGEDKETLNQSLRKPLTVKASEDNSASKAGVAADKMERAADKMDKAASKIPSEFKVKAQVKKPPNTGAPTAGE